MMTFPIIEKLGGPAAVYAELRSRSARWTTEKAIWQWHKRGRISAEAQGELMRLAEERGIPYCADDFVLNTETRGAA